MVLIVIPPNTVSTELCRCEEWTIENFSFWNREIHGKVVSTPKPYFDPDFMLHLYPRGQNGCGERLVVSFNCSSPVTFSGILSFIGPNGSILCAQRFSSKGNTQDFTLPPGPKFEEVVSEIKKNQDVHGDRLIVRYRIKRHIDSQAYRTTTLQVFDVTFKVSFKILDDLDSTGKVISRVTYPWGEEKIGKLKLRISKGQIDRTDILLSLQPDPHESNVLVHTSMSVLNDRDVARTEENRHLFLDGGVWTFAKSLSMGEVAKKGAFMLRFKMIPNTKHKGCVGVLHYHRHAVSLLASEKLSPVTTVFVVTKKPLPRKEQSLSSLKNLSEELMCLYQDQDFSDFTLKCDGVSIPVHRNILSARSPVFKRMLTTDMREAASSEVDIGDLDPSTLVRFLTFLYTGVVGEDLEGESALNLYYAADKYQIPSLKKECADFLGAHVCISNVCDVLSLASRHQDDQLVAFAREFILKNFDGVLATEEWKTFMRREPLLAAETLTYFAQEKNIGRI